MVMKKGDEMIEYTAQPFLAISALHSEVRAVSLAVQALQSANLNHAVIVTDCKQLSEAISAKDPPINLDWRLYSENFQVWLFVKDNSGISCVFIGREHNIEAHQLANWVRIEQQQLSGNTSPPCNLCMNCALMKRLRAFETKRKT
jgi:ribonuclease HI